MSGSILDLSNSANWEPVFSIDTTVAKAAVTTKYIKVDPIKIPFTIDTPIVATYSSSSDGKPTWKYSGVLSQQVALGITVGGSQDADVQNTRRVLLNRLKLIFWPQLVTEYALEFKPFYWLNKIEFSLWKYTGPIEDSTLEAIDQARIDILRTEQIAKLLLEEVRDG